MREYKFQAYDKDGIYTEDGKPEMLENITGKTYFDHIWHDDDFIKRQWIGILDKNGKEIYEGDIIEIKHPHKGRYYKGIVVYEKYYYTGKDFNFPHYDNPSNAFEDMTYVEVVGNIYENPKLLENEGK